jgi:hypothetical protein
MPKAPEGPASRPYELSFETRPEFLYARIAAPSINRSLKLDYLAEVLLKCAQSRCSQILLDRDIPAMVADEEFESTIDDVVRASENVAIAFVNKHKEIEPRLKRFVTNGKRRGGKFRYFADRESAEKWLLKQYRLN